MGAPLGPVIRRERADWSKRCSEAPFKATVAFCPSGMDRRRRLAQTPQSHIVQVLCMDQGFVQLGHQCSPMKRDHRRASGEVKGRKARVSSVTLCEIFYNGNVS